MLKNFNKAIEAQNFLYKACGFKFTDLIAEAESERYYAHYYILENKHVRFRISKKTPTKTGQFVTMWKRVSDSKIRPYDQSDEVDFFVIILMHEDRVGQFVFPKSVLAKKKIFSKNRKGGKRAIRVYSPWDVTNSIQATRTKEWQIQYFVDITPGESVDIEQVKKLYDMFLE